MDYQKLLRDAYTALVQHRYRDVLVDIAVLESSLQHLPPVNQSTYRSAIQDIRFAMRKMIENDQTS